MIRGLAHLCFIVKDLEVSQEFYCDKLGLKHAFDFVRDSGERFGMYIHVGGRAKSGIASEGVCCQIAAAGSTWGRWRDADAMYRTG